MFTPCESRGVFLPVPMLLVMKLFLFGIPRLLDHLNDYSVLGFGAIARVSEVDWSAWNDQSWLSYEYREEVLIVINAGAQLKRVLSHGSKEWNDGRDDLCLVYFIEFNSSGLTKKFAR